MSAYDRLKNYIVYREGSPELREELLALLEELANPKIKISRAKKRSSAPWERDDEVITATLVIGNQIHKYRTVIHGYYLDRRDADKVRRDFEHHAKVDLLHRVADKIATSEEDE